MSISYYSLGLMSGTSGDGIDASIIKSNGKDKCDVISDNYYKYSAEIYVNIHDLREKIKQTSDLKNYSNELEDLEKKITLFHAYVVKEIIKDTKENIDFIGFHGQTIFHNPKEKISKQLGLGKKLSEIIKKTVIYNFRENDLKNGGEGAPLSPIFHKLLVEQNKINLPVTILNIGGIANITSLKKNKMFSFDIGPGSCLIDKWIGLNSEKTFDKDGKIARSGKIDKFILEKSLDNFYKNKISKNRSFDIKDFDLSFVRGLSIEDGAAMLTEFTADIQSQKIIDNNIYACGGGRKNKFLIECIEKRIKSKIKLIDDLDVDGDFIESQAFAYLAIRSYLKLPISFPETTGCKEACSGGVIIKSF